MMKHFFQPLVLGLTLALPAIVSAVPISWSANGHSYDAVFSPTDTHPKWETARAAAAALTLDGASGYLATFTTQEEQEFVISNLGGGVHLEFLWLGGYQDSGSAEPYGG